MNLRLLAAFLLILSCGIGKLNAQGTWTPLTHQAPGLNNGVMLQLTDGSVISITTNDPNAAWDDSANATWNKLTPDSTGSYINGHWDTIASMAYSRIYFSSWVLPSGKVYVAGGEFGTGSATAELYDPIADTWTFISGIESPLLDCNSAMLPDGRILQNSVLPDTDGGVGTLNYFYDPATNTFSSAPFGPNPDDEATWLMLPDYSILYETTSDTTTQRFIPQLNRWVPDAPMPASLYDVYGDETGAAFMLPDGRAFFLGSNGNTAYYTPSGDTSPGSWAAGPVIPNGLGTPDAPAAMLPDGRILCAFSQAPDGFEQDSIFHSLTYYYLFDSRTDSFKLISAPGGGDSIAQPCFASIMLNLPDGTILLGVEGSTRYYVYNPQTAPLTAAKPIISAVTGSACSNYMVTGTSFNGISMGSAYGDDWQMATNYPVVRLIANGHTWFARTTNWNRFGVQTGALADTTYFTLPDSLPNGAYSLLLSANGISCDTFLFNYSNCATALEEPGAAPALRIYPNPTADIFVIDFTAGSGTALVFNSLGQCMQQLPLTQGLNQVNLAAAPSGIYYIRVQAEGEVLTGKLV